uniref:Putative multicopper oxidase n=1 Tax=Rhodnius prolixus TaxID=13249 RepID=R4FLW6_RHOPR
MESVLKKLLTNILLIGFLVQFTAQTSINSRMRNDGEMRNKRSIKEQEPVDGETKCARKCDGKPLTCYYKLHVEPYSTMGSACGNCPENITACWDPQCITADGFEKGIFVFNRRLPGSPLRVCVGDKIVVDVINMDGHRTTSVHWHGFRQKGTQYSDGVPYVTQCPILPMSTFRYIFYGEDAGSFFYHSHSGVQKIDGLTGPIVVRDVLAAEPYAHLYDYDLFEHEIFIQDWTHTTADSLIPGLKREGSLPKSLLINGRGIKSSEDTTDPQRLILQAQRPKQLPLSVFTVKPGKRYRFRLISSTCMACTVKLIVQGHKMTVINADGPSPVSPTIVDVVSFNSGDRFDVIIEANNKVNSYWILVQGQGSCSDAMQLAVLKYDGSNGNPSSNVLPKEEKSVVLNPTNPTCEKEEEMCVSKLTSPYQAPSHIVHGPGSVRLILQFGFYFYSKNELFNNNGSYSPYFEPAHPLLVRAQINSITNTFAPMPLLSQYNEIPNSAFCKKECYTERENCKCTSIYKVPLHSVVDVIVVDSAMPSKNGLTHPFHLHGYNFYLLKEGTFKNGMLHQGIEELNRWLDSGAMENKSTAVLKDSIGVPSGGYAVLRFHADNPGFWIFHCHFTLHLDMGMAAILQVGELHEMPSPPPGFPKCGNYLPPIS